jgi:transcriptional regulator with XRE-family HTH domain
MYVITYRPMTTLVRDTDGSTAAPAVGERVRALREAMDLSLRDLAERTGVSAPMLSQVERGETSPTLAVATKIASGLELSLSQLLRLDEASHVVVTRRADRRGHKRDGHSVEELTPPLPGQRAELSLHVLDPGAATGGPGDPPIHEPGSRETIYLNSGRAALVLDGERYELGEGDAVTFDADLPHHFENDGGEPAELLAVVAAGLRRS